MNKPETPGVGIFTDEWFDIIFEGTEFNDPDKLWVRRATEKICKGWHLGDSKDPIFIANYIHMQFLVQQVEDALGTNSNNEREESSNDDAAD